MKKILFGMLLALVFAGAGLVWLAQRPMQFQNDVLAVRITPGAGIEQVGEALHQAGLPLPVWVQMLIGRAKGYNGKLRAGYYEFKSGLSFLEILGKIARGETTQVKVRIIEGWTFAKIRQSLEQNSALTIDTVGMSEADLLSAVGSQAKQAEGLFFPATYTVDKLTSTREVFRQAYEVGRQRLAKAWAQRTPGLPLANAYEALILASLIEKETGLAADRGKIGSVFINRLSLDMPLQTDPTLIYGMGDMYDGKLGREDKYIDHPYNTYKYKGLPPTPIAAAGDAALLAATQPPKTDFLYFVARGDGSSQFSQNLDQHNRAVNTYLKGAP